MIRMTTKQIKHKLIKMLGGLTVEEGAAIYVDGCQDTLVGLKQYAESIYGLPADKWAKYLYDKICNSIKPKD